MTIISTMLSKSVSNVYDDAKKEWDFNGTVNDYGPVTEQKPPQKCQLCGHPIRYGYILNNSKNTKSVEVGSECINNYMMVTPTVMKKMEVAKKKAKNQLKVNAKKAYGLANNEADKVVVAVFKEKNYTDRDAIGSVTNNHVVLMDKIQSGVLFALAKKYGVTISMSRAV